MSDEETVSDGAKASGLLSVGRTLAGCAVVGVEGSSGGASIVLATAEVERDVALAICPDLADVERERDELRARVAEMEAPPVVPPGYAVPQVVHEVDPGEYLSRWELWDDPVDPDFGPYVIAEVNLGGLCVLRGEEEIHPAAVRALLWAIEHDKRPPHETDATSTPLPVDVQAPPPVASGRVVVREEGPGDE